MTPQPTTSVNATNSGRKRAVLVVCQKCKKRVDVKKTALCFVCKNRYELDCDGYPEQTYRLMDQESKNRWRCKLCIKKMASCSKDASNITVRKKPVVPTTESSPDTQTKPSINQLSSIQDSHVLTDYDTSYDSDTSPNVHSKSVDGTTTNISSLSEMQDTIVQLTAKLETTEHELENSILENNDLNKQLTKLTTEIKILKTLCHSSTMIESSPINNDKKKKHSRFSQNVSSTPSSTRVRDYASHASHQCLQQKIINLEKNLQNAKDEIKRLTTQIQLLEHSLCSKPKPEWTLKPLNLSTKDITSHLQQRIPEKTIAIFGAQQCVGLAAALQDSRKSTQYEKYGIFAHTMPNANSDTIVKCCTKANLKPEDKIIICLGENDRIVGSVLTQLKNVLTLFHKNSIIVLNVLRNDHLNVKKLNNSIKNLCKHYKNSYFTNSTYSGAPDIRKSINYIIDCEDYDRKYLNPVEIRKILVSSKLSFLSKTKSNAPKKGTIPFYFKMINSEEVNNVTSIPSIKPKKGTIPFYFQPHTKNNTFFRA